MSSDTGDQRTREPDAKLHEEFLNVLDQTGLDFLSCAPSQRQKVEDVRVFDKLLCEV